MPEARSPMGNSLGKMYQKETRIPKGKEWALNLVQMIPDKHKPLVMEFLKTVDREDLEAAAEHLAGLVDGMRDRILTSKYPDVEINSCINETRRWLSLQ